MTHPEITHALLWTGKEQLVFRSQPSRLASGAFCAEDQTQASDFTTWWNLDAKMYIDKLRKYEAHEGKHLVFDDHWVSRGDKWQYQSLVMFIPRGASPERPALAGFIYDTDYLKNKFFPGGTERSDARSEPRATPCIREPRSWSVRRKTTPRSLPLLPGTAEQPKSSDRFRTSFQA